MHLKIVSAIVQTFCLGFNALKNIQIENKSYNTAPSAGL